MVVPRRPAVLLGRKPLVQLAIDVTLLAHHLKPQRLADSAAGTAAARPPLEAIFLRNGGVPETPAGVRDRLRADAAISR